MVTQEVILQVTHHGVQLCDRIAQRCASCKDNALAACLFVEVSAFEEKIKCFLRSRVGNSGYILQFCGDEQIFELVGFIDEQAVDTELFKCQRIVLSCFFELVKLFLQTLSGSLHSLDLELRAFALFQFLNALQNIVDLALYGHDLSLFGNRNLTELRVTDDNCIVVASSDFCKELLAIFFLEILFGRNKNVCTWV